MDRAEEARLDRIINLLFVSRKTATKAAAKAGGDITASICLQNPLSKSQDIELVLEDRLNVAAEKAAHDPAQAAAIAEAAKAAESERGVQDEETRDALVTSDELAQRLEKDPNKRAALLERLNRVQQA